jgi:hypothetical protein
MVISNDTSEFILQRWWSILGEDSRYELGDDARARSGRIVEARREPLLPNRFRQ